ncbi:transcriptional regulator GlxA family with amidase domain [Pedobacter cryoconitis]|uniref:DJ-1/PfpI family protein n=1 Tax=Pedobacter cryoconitis TaxID=188932 RepID=UPI0016211462|nr:DJ-1/PfpI family protein [Pedobacter cryoconitis]MBB6269713.1 transcriptional regulator GlxA family with amidase domain [Pedobacter cryoconitis]
MKQLLLLIFFIPCFAFAQVYASTYVCPPFNHPCDTNVYQQPGVCAHCGMTLTGKNERVSKDQKITVCFYLYDGVEVLDFAGPMEVFSYAGFKIITVAKTKAPLLSQGILKIIPDYSIKDAPQTDIFAVFGGSDEVAADDPEVISWIKSRDSTTKSYFSVCTGAFILGKAGLLDQLTVTTFHKSITNLQKAVPKAKVLQNVRYVDNGRVITTAGISAGIDGALHLVSKLRGKEVAEAVAKQMEYDKYVPEQGLNL